MQSGIFFPVRFVSHIRESMMDALPGTTGGAGCDT